MFHLLAIATAVGCATTLGALPILVSREVSRATYDTMLGLGAGLMLAAATLGLLTEALVGVRAGGAIDLRLFGLVLAGFGGGVALLFGMDRLIPHAHAGGHAEHLHGHEHEAHEHCHHTTVDERARKLVVAERVLLRNVKETNGRFSWIAHTTNVVLNVAAGLIVWLGFHDGWLALESTLVGVGVGELQILSQPWNALIDLRAYQARFGGMATTGPVGAPPLAIGTVTGSGRVSLFGFDLVR